MRFISKDFYLIVFQEAFLNTFLVQNSVLELKCVIVNNCIHYISKASEQASDILVSQNARSLQKINIRLSVQTSEKHEKIKKQYCIKDQK